MSDRAELTPKISGSFANFALTARLMAIDLRKIYPVGSSPVADMLVAEADKLATRFDAWPNLHPGVIAFERLFLPDMLKSLLAAAKAFREEAPKLVP